MQGWLGPIWRTITPVGRTVIVLCVLGWILAGALGWLEAAVLAAACLILLGISVVFTVGRTSLEVFTVVEPLRVTVGEALTGELAARNTARTPLVSASLEFPIGQGGVTYDLPVLVPGQTHTELFVVPTRHRGVIDVGPVTTVRGDPLGLLRRTNEWTERTEIFVHPKIIALEPFGAGLIRDLEGTTAQSVSMSDLAFHALREYVPGDDLRHVHWRSSARHGQLLVRQFLDTRRSHLVVLVDGRVEAYGSEEDFETAIGVAGSLLRRGLLDEYDVSFVCGDVLTVRGRGRGVLDGCARAAPNEHSPVDAAVTGSRIAPDASLVVMLTGAATDYLTLQRAAGQFGVETARAAIRIDPARDPSLRTAADLPVLTVGELAHLPLVLRWGLG